MTDAAQQQRTALVTGASRGLGEACARALAAEGWRVVCLARDAAALERVARDITQAGGAALALALDLADDAELALPRVDALVHAAAAFAPFAALERIAPRELDAVLDVNLRAALRLTRCVLPGMRARRFGRLIYIGSLAASLGGAGQAAYAAAKAGLTGLARSVAVEAGGEGVTANIVELGLFDTERTRSALSAVARAGLIAATPAGRAGRVEEAAEVVAFLASERASFINGAVLPVTGGLGLGLLASAPRSDPGQGGAQ